MNETLRRLTAEASRRQDLADEKKRQAKAVAFKEPVQQVLGAEALGAFDNATFKHDRAGSFMTFSIDGIEFEIRQGPMSGPVLISLSMVLSHGKKNLLFINLRDEGARDTVLRRLSQAIADADQLSKPSPEYGQRMPDDGQRMPDGSKLIPIAPELLPTFPDAESVNNGAWAAILY